ncbi:astacin-like metalloendopeptidase [Eudromia elegans]
MALAWGVWVLLSGAFGLLEGGPGGTGRPRGGGTPRGDDILSINGALQGPNGSFLLEGDIVRAAPGRAWAGASARWPKHRGLVRIPYELSPRYDEGSVRLLREAFADFARLTCVRFVPRSHQRDFVSIAPMSGCFSSVGRAGGRQPLSLAPACLRRGKGVALHELMHVAGFWHEHSRADRDGHVRIAWEHVLPGFEGNFLKSRTPNMLVGYDYSSVLHYSRYAFSRSGAPTITPLRPPGAALGQRRRLSPSDVDRVNRLYGCRGPGTPGSATASAPGTPRGTPVPGRPVGPPFL